MSLETLIQEVHRRNLLINNLFQLHNRRWQANVTDEVRYWEFGHGDTAEAALRAALFKVDTTMPEIVMDRPIKTEQYSRSRTLDEVVLPEKRFQL